MQNVSKSKDVIFKFILFSAIGVLIFFINIKIGAKDTVPLVHIIDAIKSALGKPLLQYIVMIACNSVLITSILCKLNVNMPQIWKNHHKKDTMFSYFTYVTAAVFSIMVVFNVGPSFVIDPKVGLSSINVAGDVISAVIVAGVLVNFLVEYGFLEFLGKLVEPIMRTLFRLPGKAAVDALSSFVASAAVGVMITGSLFKKNVYTEREACSVTTNFSFCSIGAFAFLSSIAGCGEYFSWVVLTALLMGFILAAIMIRIPPLSLKKNVYYDGTVQSDEDRKSEKYHKGIFKEALAVGIEKAENTNLAIFWEALIKSVMFAQKVSAFVVSLSVICLAVANYTPIISIIGTPMVPILKLLQIPDAEIIAPSTLVGFLALSLPATLLKDTGVSAMAAFFIVVLSTSQIIFFTESANAMLESEMPLSFWDLLLIFILRTIILIPLVAIVAHMIF